jgi:hypothetical protein
MYQPSFQPPFLKSGRDLAVENECLVLVRSTSQALRAGLVRQFQFDTDVQVNLVRGSSVRVSDKRRQFGAALTDWPNCPPLLKVDSF